MSRGFKIRLSVQEKHFRSLREKIGVMRQQRRSMEFDATAIKIQKLCGEIEQTLYCCQRLV